VGNIFQQEVRLLTAQNCNQI